MSSQPETSTQSSLQAVDNFVNALYKGEPHALKASEELRDKGFQFKIKVILDSSGSMREDQILALEALKRWIADIDSSIPEELTDAIEDPWISLSGNIMLFRDILSDSTPFQIAGTFNRSTSEEVTTLLNQVYDASSIYGGGNGQGESQLLALLFGIGLPINHPAISYAFKQLNSDNYPILKNTIEAFKNQYNTDARSTGVPNVILLVTDEPPRQEQEDITNVNQLIRIREELGQTWPGIIFFVRNSSSCPDNFWQWTEVGNSLGAKVYNLDELDSVKPEERVGIVANSINTIAGPLLTDHITQQINLLPATTGNGQIISL